MLQKEMNVPQIHVSMMALAKTGLVASYASVHTSTMDHIVRNVSTTFFIPK